MIIFVSQRLRLDKTSNADPLQLLDKISRDGISQDVCINDLGMHPCRSLERPIFSFSFIYIVFAAYVCFCLCFGIIYCTQSYVMIYAYIFMQSLIISVLIYSVFTPSALTLWLSGVTVFTYIDPYGR